MELLAVVEHSFNASRGGGGGGGGGRWISLSLRPAWSTEQVPEQPGLLRETLSQNKIKNKNKKKG